MKLTELIGKKLVAMFEGKEIGTAIGAYALGKLKKVKAIIIQSSQCGAKFYVLIRDIYSVGDQVVLVKNMQKILPCAMSSVASNVPIGANVYMSGGESLGKTLDFIFDEYGNILSVRTMAGDINLPVVSFSDSVIILRDKGEKSINISPKKKTLRREAVESAEALNYDGNGYITNYGFLLGRVLCEDILLPNGMAIAKRGSYVTKDMVFKLKALGKIVELIRKSRARV